MIRRLSLAAETFLTGESCNYVHEDDAMREDLVGMRIYDSPIFAVGDAKDVLFQAFARPEIIHPEYMLPTDWLSNAKSVLSFFVPFTERVKGANAAPGQPADEWLHGRCEGQEALSALCECLCGLLKKDGYSAIAPMSDPRIRMLGQYASNWSERHTGYVCGLGTFGVSKNLITEKGAAGRIGSIVTSCELPATERKYDDPYAYCSRCGACERRCPARCIDMSRGDHLAKGHVPCGAFLDHIQSMPPRGKSMKVRYGCGKCQTGVPCQDRNSFCSLQ